MSAKKYNPGRVEVDPEYPFCLNLNGKKWAFFHGESAKEDCAFAVAAINAAVDKLEKEEKPQTCVWKLRDPYHGTWESTCGDFIYLTGGDSPIDLAIERCTKCKKPIEQSKPEPA